MAENQQSSTTTKHTDFDDLLSSLTTFLDSTPDPNYKQNDVLRMEMDKACKELSAATQTLFGPGGKLLLFFTFNIKKLGFIEMICFFFTLC